MPVGPLIAMYRAIANKYSKSQPNKLKTTLKDSGGALTQWLAHSTTTWETRVRFAVWALTDKKLSRNFMSSYLRILAMIRASNWLPRYQYN